MVVWSRVTLLIRMSPCPILSRLRRGMQIESHWQERQPPGRLVARMKIFQPTLMAWTCRRTVASSIAPAEIGIFPIRGNRDFVVDLRLRADDPHSAMQPK